jgi:3-hydroxyisobutyrate dehydrogenase
LHDLAYCIAAVFDVRTSSAKELAGELNAQAMVCLQDVSRAADVILTIVSDDAAMYSIFSDDADSLLAAAEGRTFLNCATVSPAVHVEIAMRAAMVGARTLEVCMASSIPQARNGTLYLMVGGERETFEQQRPLLEAMSATLRYIGPAGRAAQVKALVNMVMNANTAALAEGLGLGSALGLDGVLLREVFSQTGAASRVLETDGADMQAREYETYFSAEHAAKDSGIALDLARVAGLKLPVARATYDQYERLKTLGLGHLDKSAIAELTFADRTSA